MKVKMESKLTWKCMGNPPGRDEPKWLRSAAMDEETGFCFAPAVMSDEAELVVTLKAARDGETPAVIRDGHVYLETGWLARAYPHVADICRLIEETMREGR